MRSLCVESVERRPECGADAAQHRVAAPRVGIIGLALVLAMATGCGAALGGFTPPDKCRASWGADKKPFAGAPRWVPGSVGYTSCKAHQKTDDLDRICAVGRGKGGGSRRASSSAARGAAMIELEDKVKQAVEKILGGVPPGTGVTPQALADDVVYATGRFQDRWEAPNCDHYVLAEVELEAFMLMVKPTVSPAALEKIDANGEAVFVQD